MVQLPDKKIIGRLEHIDIPNFGLSGIEAKVDTGAYNNSIHVSYVEEFDRDGTKYIRFVVLDEKHPEFNDKVHETSNFEVKVIKSSTGEEDKRYVLPVTIILRGIELDAKMSLSNREEMRYPVLLGRKMLKKHFIIDVTKTFTE